MFGDVAGILDRVGVVGAIRRVAIYLSLTKARGVALVMAPWVVVRVLGGDSGFVAFRVAH